MFRVDYVHIQVYLGKQDHSWRLRYGRPLSAAKNDPPDQLRLVNLVLLGPQGDHFWQPKAVRGDCFSAAKISPGPTFGPDQFSHDRLKYSTAHWHMQAQLRGTDTGNKATCTCSCPQPVICVTLAAKPQRTKKCHQDHPMLTMYTHELVQHYMYISC